MDSPRCLDGFYRLKAEPRVYIAGQLSGVEGYIESVASGFYAGLHAACALKDIPFTPLPRTTAVGALAAYVSDGSVRDFQPMNINFGLIEPLGERVGGKKNRNLAISNRSLEIIENITAGFSSKAQSKDSSMHSE